MRADTQAKTLDVTYHAEVRQATGEDWKGVSLRLSTAQPALAGREPRMDPWFLAKFEPQNKELEAVPLGVVSSVTAGRKAGSDRGNAQMFNQIQTNGNNFAVNGILTVGLPREELAKRMHSMDERRATVQAGGTAATFLIERKSDILTDNKPAQVTVMRKPSLPTSATPACRSSRPSST